MYIVECRWLFCLSRQNHQDYTLVEQVGLVAHYSEGDHTVWGALGLSARCSIIWGEVLGTRSLIWSGGSLEAEIINYLNKSSWEDYECGQSCS